ncbi:DUF7221 family queuine tRNA-ribosyltransferase-like protein [Gloeothece verrucosa]|uniref:DeoxyPurine in DNA protein A domain-containing protein n=1 Tax=Gloeothece verrucosa (strain PCC 7822) TaxID=497965 RepID=E0U6Y9_GLOV7|nr:hypothetical protein [Gloeothece verrucosa]ADN16026.1 hypothetical protein Cyan7822_4106 [Gloeothece verrucosa PCC 7822]
MSDNVQNHLQPSDNTSPLFFIGCSPSQAKSIINPAFPAAGAMISVNTLRSRQSDFQVGDWILDSGAFTEISRYGHYRFSVEEYCHQIGRWSRCGNLLQAVSQDFMCEPFILEKTGLSVELHQQLTIERFDQLRAYSCVTQIMPVIQGYQVADYITHVQMYGDRLSLGAWCGVGSVCRRNGNPKIIKDILKSIKVVRPDLRLHGFGLKHLALEDSGVRQLLYSSDSMAWSIPRRFGDKTPMLKLAYDYQQALHESLTDSVQKRIPITAGAGNGQGRKPTWKAGKTKAIRVPERFADELLKLAREWDNELDNR